MPSFPEHDERNLESVAEHNARRREERRGREDAARRTGVACPACGEELLWEVGVCVTTLQQPTPTTRPAACRCGVAVDVET